MSETRPYRYPLGDPPYYDPEFDMKGYGMLNPFKKHLRRCEEEVKMANVRERSHDNFTFHLPVPEDFDRRLVLPAEQMRALRELGSRIIRARKERERLENEKLFIAEELANFIVEKAAVILFNTPVPTEIPTDSFAEDYDVDFVRLVEKDLKL